MKKDQLKGQTIFRHTDQDKKKWERLCDHQGQGMSKLIRGLLNKECKNKGVE